MAECGLAHLSRMFPGAHLDPIFQSFAHEGIKPQRAVRIRRTGGAADVGVVHQGRLVGIPEHRAQDKPGMKRSRTALLLLGEEGFRPVGAIALLVGALFGGAGECAEVGELVAVLGA